MIIVNQDNTEIMNFDNIMNINICGDDEDGYSISAGFIVGRDDNYRELGIYHTEKRAKEVLKEIYISYANWQMVNIPKVEIHEEISANRMFGTICYRMPEK